MASTENATRSDLRIPTKGSSKEYRHQFRKRLLTKKASTGENAVAQDAEDTSRDKGVCDEVIEATDKADQCVGKDLFEGCRTS